MLSVFILLQIYYGTSIFIITVLLLPVSISLRSVLIVTDYSKVWSSYVGVVIINQSCRERTKRATS